MRRVKWRRSHQSSKWLKLSEIRQKILNFDEFTFFPDIISFFKVKKNYFLFLDFQNSQILKFLMYNLGKKPKKNVGMLDPDSGLSRKWKWNWGCSTLVWKSCNFIFEKKNRENAKILHFLVLIARKKCWFLNWK